MSNHLEAAIGVKSLSSATHLAHEVGREPQSTFFTPLALRAMGPVLMSDTPGAKKLQELHVMREVTTSKQLKRKEGRGMGQDSAEQLNPIAAMAEIDSMEAQAAMDAIRRDIFGIQPYTPDDYIALMKAEAAIEFANDRLSKFEGSDRAIRIQNEAWEAQSERRRQIREYLVSQDFFFDNGAVVNDLATFMDQSRRNGENLTVDEAVERWTADQDRKKKKYEEQIDRVLPSKPKTTRVSAPATPPTTTVLAPQQPILPNGIPVDPDDILDMVVRPVPPVATPAAPVEQQRAVTPSASAAVEQPGEGQQATPDAATAPAPTEHLFTYDPAAVDTTIRNLALEKGIGTLTQGEMERVLAKIEELDGTDMTGFDLETFTDATIDEVLAQGDGPTDGAALSAQPESIYSPDDPVPNPRSAISNKVIANLASSATTHSTDLKANPDLAFLWEDDVVPEPPPPAAQPTQTTPLPESVIEQDRAHELYMQRARVKSLKGQNKSSPENEDFSFPPSDGTLQTLCQEHGLTEEAIKQHGLLYIMSDGVTTGGHGKDASTALVSATIKAFYSNENTIFDTKTRLIRAIVEGKQAISIGSTTGVFCVEHNGKIYLSGVGDTRLYGYNKNGDVDILSKDSDKDSQGRLTIGFNATLQQQKLIDELNKNYYERDTDDYRALILLTDGSYEGLGDDDHGILGKLRSIMGDSSLDDQEIMNKLVDEARNYYMEQAGFSDDTTAMLIRFLERDAQPHIQQREVPMSDTPSQNQRRRRRVGTTLLR